jgi:WD40 repeat protein
MTSDAHKQAKDKLQAAIDANMEKSSKKKFMGTGKDSLPDLKDASLMPFVLQEIKHGKKHENGRREKIQTIAWGPNEGDDRLGVIDQLGTVFVWDTVKSVRLMGCDSKFAQAIAISPNVEKPLVLVGGMKNATELYVKEGSTAKLTPDKKKVWIQHDGYISSLHFLAGGASYISSGGDAEIRVFDIEKPATEPAKQVFRGHSKDCQSIKFPRDLPEKNIFITCSSDKTVKLWDMRMNVAAQTFTTDSELNACSIFPDGSLIACGGEKDKTYVFDVRSNAQVGKYARNNMKTASCEFSKSGRSLFVGHDDGAIIVWDIFGSGDNKNYAVKVPAHTTKIPGTEKVDDTKSRVQALSVGPKGYLASGGFNGEVKIWGLESAKA